MLTRFPASRRALRHCSLTLSLLAGVTLAAHADDRVIDTAYGKVTVSGTPGHVVALDEQAVDTVLAVGEKPAGALATRGAEGVSNYLKDRAEGVPIVGTSREINLEAVLAAQPDLILAGARLDKTMYDKLSQIAPTIVPTSSLAQWKDSVMIYATAMNKADEAQQALQQIDTRIAALKPKMPAGATVSVVRWMPQGALVMSSHLIVGETLQALGLKTTALSDSLVKKPHSDILSLENLSQVDGDWMFLATLNEKGKEALDNARQQPAFQRLKAAQNNHVVPVDGQVWSSGSGILAANRLLDDLEQNLAN